MLCFEDYGNGILKEEKLVEAIDIIDEAKTFYKERQSMTTKKDIKKAKQMPNRTETEAAARNEAIQKAKAAYKATVKVQREEKEARIAAAKKKPESERKAALKKYNGTEKEIEVPSSIEANEQEYTVVGIDNKAFYKNQNLQKLVISDSVLVVGNFAFMSCKNLESLVIGANVDYIGVSAFQADKAPQNNREKRLDADGKEILNPQGEPIFYDGVGHLQHIDWQGAPKVIAENAFYLNDKLDEIVLPEGVEEIGEWAFAKCSGANKIILPNGLKKIGAYSFMKDVLTEEIIIPGTCKVISQSAFYRNSNAKHIVLEEGVKTLAQGAFEECASVETMKLPQSVTTVEKYAFSACTAMQELQVKEGTTIYKEAFINNHKVNVVNY